MSELSCPRCGAAFACTPGAECWCARLPFGAMPEDATSCLCPACLARETAGAGEPIIASAERADAAELLALQQLAYQSEALLYGDDIPPLRQTLAELGRDFADGPILKAVEDGHIIGSVRARRRGDACEIGRLIVHPACQRRGLGSRLMAAIENACADAARFELFTGDRSAGNLRLYQRLGYRECRREPVHPGLTLVFLEKARAS